jgi:hypothetical protein
MQSVYLRLWPGFDQISFNCFQWFVATDVRLKAKEKFHMVAILFSVFKLNISILTGAYFSIIYDRALLYDPD